MVNNCTQLYISHQALKMLLTELSSEVAWLIIIILILNAVQLQSIWKLLIDIPLAISTIYVELVIMSYMCLLYIILHVLLDKKLFTISIHDILLVCLYIVLMYRMKFTIHL